MMGDGVTVEQRQQLNAAVSAPHRNESRDVRVVPGSRERCGPDFGGAGDIALSSEDALLEDRFEAEGPELDEAGLELLALERAGRRHHGDPVAGPQRARLAHQLDEPRHLGGNRLMLVAAEGGAQRRAGQGPRPRRRQEPFLDAAVARQRILDALQRKRLVLDRADDGFERRKLRLLRGPHISTASQPAAMAPTVASGTP